MKRIGTRELQTARMTLRKIRKEDTESLYLSGCLGKNPQDAESMVANIMKHNDELENFHWVLEYQNKAIGRIRGWDIDVKNNYVQLGYEIGAQYRSMGLMTEAAKMVTTYLLNEASFHKVYCMVRKSNLASIRVCQKLGMVQEGILRKHWIEEDGSYIDVYVYGLVKDE